MHPSHAPWRLLDKLVLLAALGIAIALFLSVGWMAIEPADPQGPVSLIAHRHGVLMAAQTAALAGVTAAIATIMIGGKLADVGVFAAAMGMAIVSVRGATASYFLMGYSGASGAAEAGLAGRLLVEAAIWSVVLLGVVVVSGVVMRWFLNFGRADSGDGNTPRLVEISDLALSDAPVLRGWLGIVPKASKHMSAGEAAASGVFGITEVAMALVHFFHRPRVAVSNRSTSEGREAEYAPGPLALFMTLLCAGIIYPLFASGYLVRSVEHGQVCFAAFAAFYIGVWVSKRSFPARTAFWPLLAVPLLLMGGYAWVLATGGTIGGPVRAGGIPHSDYLRALPLTFISFGALGVLTAHWVIEPTIPQAAEPEPAAKRPVRRGRGGS